MSEEPTNPDVLLVPCDDPGAAEAEYGPQGWKASDIYTKAGYAELCDGHNWAVRFFRTAQPKQRELL